MWFRGLRKGLNIQIVYLYHWCCHYIDLVNKPWVLAKSVHFEDICMHCLWTIQCLWDRNYNAYTFLASSATSLNQSLDSNASFFSIFLLIPLLKIRPFFFNLLFFPATDMWLSAPISSKTDRKKNNKELLYVFSPVTTQDLIQNLSDLSDCFQEKNILIIRSSW